MFLLVSSRHFGAHPDHQHGVSTQIFINLDETLLRIARELKTTETRFLARLFILQSSIISQILEFIYWTVTIFSFDYMTDENQEFFPNPLSPFRPGPLRLKWPEIPPRALHRLAFEYSCLSFAPATTCETRRRWEAAVFAGYAPARCWTSGETTYVSCRN